MIGEVVGAYRIVEKIGEGGMGVVYRAEHPLLKRRAAVKMLLPEFSGAPEIVNRFFNEARATTLVGHAGLVDIFDFGYHPSGCAYIAMEYLAGESLAARIRRQRALPEAHAVAIARQIASALAATHAKQIVHRDLKPDNVFLVPDPEMQAGVRVKILDFGIAKLAGQAVPGSVRTRTGSTLGTPLYMSPEQCRDAAEVDGRSDIYSLGCILFEMVVGRAPFLGQGAGDLIVAHLRDAPPKVRSLAPSVSPELESVVSRALEKQLDARIQTMADLAAELEALGRLRAPTAQTFAASSDAASGSVSSARLAVPTTLAGSAAQVRESPRRRGAWLLPSVLGGAALVGSIAYLFHTRGRARQDSGHTEQGHTETRPAVVAAPAPVVVPARSTIRIEALPVGADVYRVDDAGLLFIGQSPVTDDVEPTRAGVEYVVKRTGFVEERVRLPVDQDGVHSIVLKPVSTPSPARPAPVPSRKAVPSRKPKAKCITCEGA